MAAKNVDFYRFCNESDSVYTKSTTVLKMTEQYESIICIRLVW